MEVTIEVDNNHLGYLCAHTRVLAHVNTHAHMYAHTHTRARTHTHTNTYTRVLYTPALTHILFWHVLYGKLTSIVWHKN
jgi:hypothetical protein